MTKAAVLWTGGKDSVLALLEAPKDLDVRCLVTFVPLPSRPFLAHPLEVMAAQASALGLEHRTVGIADPAASSYERAIESLAQEGFEVLLTGDIDEVDGHANWMIERSRDLVRVVRPLWRRDRPAILKSLLAHRVRAIVSLARRSPYEETLVGREFDETLVEELIDHHGRDGFDACGENGEYHSTVLWAPGFEVPVILGATSIQSNDQYVYLRSEGVAIGAPTGL